MRTRLAALAVGTALLAGCSSSGAPAPDSLAGLRSDVRAMAAAAAARQYRSAATALTRLRADVAAAKATGEISPAKLAAIEAAIEPVATDIAAQLRPTPKPTPTRTTATPTRSTPAPKPAPKPAPRHHKKHGDH